MNGMGLIPVQRASLTDSGVAVSRVLPHGSPAALKSSSREYNMYLRYALTLMNLEPDAQDYNTCKRHTKHTHTHSGAANELPSVERTGDNLGHPSQSGFEESNSFAIRSDRASVNHCVPGISRRTAAIRLLIETHPFETTAASKNVLKIHKSAKLTTSERCKTPRYRRERTTAAYFMTREKSEN